MVGDWWINVTMVYRKKGNRIMHRSLLLSITGVAENAQGGKKASDITRQLRQAGVMLKSAAALTSASLRCVCVNIVWSLCIDHHTKCLSQC